VTARPAIRTFGIDDSLLSLFGDVSMATFLRRALAVLAIRFVPAPALASPITFFVKIEVTSVSRDTLSLVRVSWTER
jgi:hypothetical protein